MKGSLVLTAALAALSIIADSAADPQESAAQAAEEPAQALEAADIYLDRRHEHAGIIDESNAAKLAPHRAPFQHLEVYFKVGEPYRAADGDIVICSYIDEEHGRIGFRNLNGYESHYALLKVSGMEVACRQYTSEVIAAAIDLAFQETILLPQEEMNGE